jgi:hypothetical protein
MSDISVMSDYLSGSHRFFFHSVSYSTVSLKVKLKGLLNFQVFAASLS